MNKNVIIKILLIIIAIILINSIPIISKASMLDNVFKEGKEFLSTESYSNITNDVDGAQIIGISKSIYNVLLTLATAVAAIIISVLGIQFITGSIEQKAKIKEQLIPFIIGCVVVFGSLGIWKLIISIGSSIQ